MIEEAFHLLRTAPLAHLAIYYIGVLPFIMAMLFFWSDMSRSGSAASRAVPGALGVGGAYLWMKVWQALFTRQMWRRLNPDGDMPRLTPLRFLRATSAQLLLHATAMPVLLFSAIIAVPFGWAFAFYQNVTVFAYTSEFEDRTLRRLTSKASRQTHFLPMAHHVMLFHLSLFSLFVLINTAMLLASLPWLVKFVTGVHSVFTTNPGAAIFNSTFLAASVAIAFACLGPLFKTFYVLRCFYGLSRETGTDLLGKLHYIQKAQKVLLIAVLACGWLAVPEKISAQEESAAPVSVKPSDLEASIGKVIQRSEYQWRLPREEGANSGMEEDGMVGRFFQRVGSSLKGFMSDVFKAIRDLFKGKSVPSGSSGPGWFNNLGFLAGLGSLKGILVIASVIALIVLLGLLVRAMVNRRSEDFIDEGEGGMGEVDLESEEILADQLPEDAWMKLAREQLAKGEHRLALRALFLANLAHLAERGVIKIIKSKTNRDYRSEVERKARGEASVIEAFGANVRTFDRVWYGMHPVDDAVFEAFSTNYERVKSNE